MLVLSTGCHNAYWYSTYDLFLLTAVAAAETEAAAAAVSVEELSDETKAALVKQVEFYFSDENLPTDAFMKKRVKAGGTQGGTQERKEMAAVLYFEVLFLLLAGWLVCWLVGVLTHKSVTSGW